MALKIKLVSAISYDEDTDPHHTAGPCPKCTYALPTLRSCAPEYWEQGFVKCRDCGAEMDLWSVALDFYKASPPWGLTALGAQTTGFTVALTTHEYLEVELQNYSVPADAQILGLNYNSHHAENGSVCALEWQGMTPTRRIPGTILRLCGWPLGEGSLPRTGDIHIRVVWMTPEDSPAGPYVISAFHSVSAGDSAPAIVFAQSAVEISLMPLIEQRFLRHASNQVVQNLMRGALTYDHALNVILPFLCGEFGIAKLPEKIRRIPKWHEKSPKQNHSFWREIKRYF